MEWNQASQVYHLYGKRAVVFGESLILSRIGALIKNLYDSILCIMLYRTILFQKTPSSVGLGKK